MSKTGDLLLSDRYRIEKVLGEGGMGAVYLAQDTRLPRQWAIKEMNGHFNDPAERQEAMESFRSEAHLLSGLNHPNLPRITDYFSDEGRHYLVMDFIEGATLEQLLDEGPMEVEAAIDVALQVTDVFDYLHTQNPPVIFRDFKPGNVMITPEGKAKLIDFGIARHFQHDKASDTRALGTPGYAAPEQYGKGQSDARTDIYALGATLHEALSGRNPTDNPFMFKPFRDTRPEVPQALEDVILKCVALKQAERFQSAAELRTALEALKEDPQAFHQLPQRLRTAPLAPPPAMGFEPKKLVLGPVKRGVVPDAEVTLKGNFNHKLKTNQKWLRVQPSKVNGSDCKVTVTASTSSMVDGGSFRGAIEIVGQNDLDPLEVEVRVEPAHLTFWSMALALVFCLSSFVPLLGFLATGFLMAMFFSTPRGERAVLKVFLVVSLFASVCWLGFGALLGFGLTKVDWTKVPRPWSRSTPVSTPAESPTPAPATEEGAWLPLPGAPGYGVVLSVDC